MTFYLALSLLTVFARFMTAKEINKFSHFRVSKRELNSSFKLIKSLKNFLDNF
jgi:hypothetical protein